MISFDEFYNDHILKVTLGYNRLKISINKFVKSAFKSDSGNSLKFMVLIACTWSFNLFVIKIEGQSKCLTKANII
jgi:hypothetical protein